MVFLIFSVLAVFLMRQEEPVTPELPSPPLKELAARHDIQLGNFTMRGMIDEQPFADILTSQFDFGMADNTPNWYFTDGGLRPSETTYNFKQMDEVMAFTESNNMPIQAHHYVWGEEKWLPDWLKKGNYSKEQLLEIIRQHILTVGGRYKGRIREWTVVNEAFTRDKHLYNLRDWWADNTGGMSYIDQSFIWAREADQNSKLILNDFGNEGMNEISDAMYEYIKGAKTRGIPIDGIGMQMHIDGNRPPAKDDVIQNMRRFADLGVEVYVTEFDVNMHDVKASADDKAKLQANIYYAMMRACIESKVCHSFAFLGITDKETWYNYMGFSDGNPLLFDRKYGPKPAFYSLRRALEQD